MTAATVADLIGQTRRMVQGTTRGSLNKLNLDIDNATQSVVLTYDVGQAAGKNAYLCLDDEIMFVWAANPSSNTLTVERAQLGTAAAAHTAGTIIEANPRFPKPFIRDALQDEILSWPRSMYATIGTTIAVATNSLSADLAGVPPTFIDVLEVLKRPTVASSSLTLDPFLTSWPEVGFRVERNMPVADFPSGSALFLNAAQSGGYTLAVTYSAPFTTSPFTDATTLSAIGLEASFIDIPPVGAAARLLAGRESVRTALEAQGESRSAVEVPVGQTLRAAAGLQALRDKRINEESERLMGRYRWRRTA